MIPLYQKLAIGAIGALCLGVLKLIEANFYLSAADRNVAVGAYLTYVCYLVLGMAVACFFAETSEEAGKTRKNCFIMGLLAPSILIAIISKPHAHTSTPPTATIQTLSQATSPLDLLLGAPVYAAEPTPAPLPDSQPTTAPLGERPIEIVDAQQLLPERGIQAGILLALGRPQGRDDFAYILGITDDQAKAVDYANALQAIVNASGGDKALQVNIILAAKQKKFLISAGEVGSLSNATLVKSDIQKLAASTLVSNGTAFQKQTAVSALKGDVFALKNLIDP